MHNRLIECHYDDFDCGIWECGPCRCYCLLHEHDAMGEILKEREDCRNVDSLEEMEEMLWGVLNEWNPEAPWKFDDVSE